MKYYVIAGEASGDLHAANLISEIKKNDNNASFRGLGGDNMIQQGVHVTKHINQLAFMGFMRVLMNIRTVLKNINICKKDILEFKPDAIILVDYPGFNLRIAKFAHKIGIKVIYYISPQIWAWKQSRIHRIKKVVDKMFVILPFEKDFYNKFNYDVEYVGNPVLDAIANYKFKTKEEFIIHNNLYDKPIIAVLPGSRKQVITELLPVMIEAANQFSDYQIVIGGVDVVDKNIYNDEVENGNMFVIYNQTYDILKHADVAIVNSGTASLEAGIIGTPSMLCYKADSISYFVIKRILKIKYVGLVNIICNANIVKELLQNKFTVNNITEELNRLLFDKAYKAQQQNGLEHLRMIIGDKGASKKCAISISKFLNPPRVNIV